MRPALVIEPGVGVGPVRFGMPRGAVHAALSDTLPFQTDVGRDMFGQDNAFQVSYEDGTASFIGIAAGIPLPCSLYGVDPFDLPAHDLLSLLTERNGGPPADLDEPLFRSIIVTLYEADEQYDWIARRAGRQPRFEVWGEVGVGDARYLAGRL
jgi:hypothetical protein